MISARSGGVTLVDSSWARATAFKASALASGVIGALMFGPWASASAQKHMAQSGSSRCASRNEAIAAAWLKP